MNTYTVYIKDETKNQKDSPYTNANKDLGACLLVASWVKEDYDEYYSRYSHLTKRVTIEIWCSDGTKAVYHKF